MSICSSYLQVAKKLVRGDYKSGRVKDPTAKISSNHEKTVKKYVSEFMDKAVKKKEERQKLKASQGGGKSDTKEGTPGTPQDAPKGGEDGWTDSMAATADDASPTDSTSDLKRKRAEEGRSGSPKRTRTGSEVPQPAPPPPPPPPASTENGESSLTPMDDASTISFPEVGDRGNTGGKTAFQLDGYGSPMQLATPPTNGSGDHRQRPLNGGNNTRS